MLALTVMVPAPRRGPLRWEHPWAAWWLSKISQINPFLHTWMVMVLPEQATGSTGGAVLKGVKGIFFTVYAQRHFKTMWLFSIVAHYRNMTCGSGKKGEGHTCGNKPNWHTTWVFSFPKTEPDMVKWNLAVPASYNHMLVINLRPTSFKLLLWNETETWTFRDPCYANSLYQLLQSNNMCLLPCQWTHVGSSNPR